MDEDWDSYFRGLRSLDKYQAMMSAVARRRRFHVGGLFGSAPALLTAAMNHEVGGVFLLACAGYRDAWRTRDDLLNFFQPDDIEVFPPWEGGRENGGEADRETFAHRLGILCRFVSGISPRIVVAPVQALAQEVVPPEAVKKNTRWIRVGKELDLKTFLPWLESRDLRRVPMAETNGEWSLRGSILDVFPYSSPKPFRIELFGDTVDSIRLYDPATQVSIRRQEECRITLIQKGRFKKPGRAGAATLLDYLPGKSLVEILEPERVQARVNEVFQRTGEPKTALAWDRFLADAARFSTLMVTALPHEAEEEGVDFVIRSVHRADPGIEGVLEGFRELVKKKASSPSAARKERGRG
ncbi:MAG: hypothetical protein ACYTFG_09505 [Planctomycetota bacterium]|jgi:transcription-repair coupling factor (superfamily II helicase)